MQKTQQFKTACKDDSGYVAQLKQQKSKRWYYYKKMLNKQMEITNSIRIY